MYDCYNEAIKYLMKKYGTTGSPKAVTYKKDKPMSDDDQIIERLVHQYYYGIAAKQELYYKLLSMNIIKETVTSLS